MNPSLKLVSDFAPGYDNYVQNCHWYGPEMLFGMMFSKLTSGQKILDLGIGTGLSAALFKKAGLEIYGVDGSEEMLKICETKQIAKELKQVDLSLAIIPFNIRFHHVISFALFHFLENLQPLFQEVSACLEENGVFGFSADIYHPETDQDYISTQNEGIYTKIQAESGLVTFKHTIPYLEHTLNQVELKILKSTEIVAFLDPEHNREVRFQLFTAIKTAKVKPF